MSRRCAVCHHPERYQLETLYLSGLSLDKLADRFGVHRDAIWRHAKSHISEADISASMMGRSQIAKLAEVAAEDATSTLDSLKVLKGMLFRLIDVKARAGDETSVSKLAGPLLRTISQLGTLTGEISTLAATSTVYNITNNQTIINSAPFLELQTGLLRICAKHPEARADVVALFSELDAKFAPKPERPAPHRPMIECEAIEIEAAANA
jgi:hypothetical protein